MLYQNCKKIKQLITNLNKGTENIQTDLLFSVDAKMTVYVYLLSKNLTAKYTCFIYF